MADQDPFLHPSRYDPVTGLPDRQLLQDRIEQAVWRSQRSATTASLVLVTLDQLAAINVTQGHRVGDAALAAVARRLEALVRPGDTLARVSADEFVVLCEDLQGSEAAPLLARRISEAFVEPFRLEDWDLEFTIGASVQVSSAGSPSEEVIDLRNPEVIDLRTSLPAPLPLRSIERAVPSRQRVREQEYLSATVRESRLNGVTDVDHGRSGEPRPAPDLLAPEMPVAALHALAEVRTTICEGIYFTRQDPHGARMVKRIEVTLSGRRSTLDDVKSRMADQARSVGAQAVVNFRYGHGGSTWWKRPIEHGRSSGGWHGEGEAVRW